MKLGLRNEWNSQCGAHNNCASFEYRSKRCLLAFDCRLWFIFFFGAPVLSGYFSLFSDFRSGCFFCRTLCPSFSTIECEYLRSLSLYYITRACELAISIFWRIERFMHSTLGFYYSIFISIFFFDWTIRFLMAFMTAHHGCSHCRIVKPDKTNKSRFMFYVLYH